MTTEQERTDADRKYHRSFSELFDYLRSKQSPDDVRPSEVDQLARTFVAAHLAAQTAGVDIDQHGNGTMTIS